MAVFVMRFDFRNPEFAGTGMADRYSAALDMVEWADRLGFVSLVLSEHHGSADGYLPSPLPMAAAMAARTEHVRIRIAAMIAPFHDPLRVAEDVAVVDLLSRGRVDLVVTNGYVPGEFEMFGRSMSERPRLTTEMVETLKQAWTGEPFEYRGRTVRVTPTPYRDGGPPVVLGGSSEAAARRAARIADDFMPSSGAVWGFYREECTALGKPDPGPYMGGDTGMFHIARDAEKGWEQLAPYAMHEVNAYGAWMAQAGVPGSVGGYESVADPDQLRATGQYRVLTPAELVAELQAKGPYGAALFHPLMGGIPPEMAWESLHLFESEVLPELA